MVEKKGSKKEPENTTSKAPQSEFLKKFISVFALVFVLLIIPISVNLALKSQDPRNSAQVISDQGVSDSNVVNSTSAPKTNQDFLTAVYPFIVGILIIIWAVILFIYFGLKFRKKTPL